MARIKLYKVGKDEYKLKVVPTHPGEGRIEGKARLVRTDGLEAETERQVSVVRRSPAPTQPS